MAYSFNGINWFPGTNATRSSGVFMNGSGNSIAWNGTIWIAGGSNSSGTALASSIDGITWTIIPGTILLTYSCVAIASRQLLPYIGVNSVQSALTSVYSTTATNRWATSVPPTIGAAIDRMASLLFTLNSNTAIP
jgi:hypothetical protein